MDKGITRGQAFMVLAQIGEKRYQVMCEITDLVM